MPPGLGELLKDPLSGAITVAAILSVVIYFLVKQALVKQARRRHSTEEQGEVADLIARLGKGWIERAERHFSSQHKISVDADEALRDVRAQREDFEELNSRHNESLIKIEGLRRDYDGLAAREKDHYEHLQQQRQEILRAVEGLAKSLTDTLNNEVRAIREAMNRIGTKR